MFPTQQQVNDLARRLYEQHPIAYEWFGMAGDPWEGREEPLRQAFRAQARAALVTAAQPEATT
jgi:hypothetical protein